MIVFTLFIVVIVVDFIFHQALDYINITSQSRSLPEVVKSYYDEATYTKQQHYMRWQYKVSGLSSFVSFLLLIAMVAFGGFQYIDLAVRSVFESSMLQAMLFFGIIGLISEVIGMPFEWYHTFVIEERFGFNRTTVKTYIYDKVKSWLLTLFIGGALLMIIINIYQLTGEWFWLVAWGVVTLFMVFMSYFYTRLFVPLFNKLSPLPEGELRNAILEVANKTGFGLRDVFVMDGSKRSSKGNAYFSGFGKKKSIVIFDTLIQEHSTEELTAVLAHEIGHYRKNHIVKGMILSVVQTGIILFLLSVFLNVPQIPNSIGLVSSFHIGVVLFGILLSPVSTLVGIGMNYILRKHEFQADKFASEYTNSSYLINALIKLSVKSLSNLTPHWLYVFVYYSHPTLIQRINALEDTNAKET